MMCECCEKEEAIHVGWFGIRICDKCQSSNIGYISIVINRLRQSKRELDSLLSPNCGIDDKR